MERTGVEVMSACPWLGSLKNKKTWNQWSILRRPNYFLPCLKIRLPILYNISYYHASAHYHHHPLSSPSSSHHRHITTIGIVSSRTYTPTHRHTHTHTHAHTCFIKASPNPFLLPALYMCVCVFVLTCVRVCHV